MSISEKIKTQLNLAHTQLLDEAQIEQSKPYIAFEKFLSVCERDIKAHYPDYELMFDHNVNEHGIISETTIELLYKAQIIHTISTGNDYLKMDGLEHYVSELGGQIAPMSLQHPVSEKVCFKDDPQRFQDITEEMLVANIVSNELQIWKKKNKTQTVELIRDKLKEELAV